jgi:hypothetical protein
MRPNSIFLRLGIAACAWLLSGCSSGVIDYGPDRLARAQLFAVTIPESLVAGQLALVTVHWFPRDCGESFLAFNALNDANGNLRLEVMTRHRSGDYLCADFYSPGLATSNSYPVMVPQTGARKLIVVGENHSFVLTLQQNLPASGPRHVIEAVRPSDGQPAPGVALSYFHESSPHDTLAAAVTDAGGRAILTLTCAGDPSADTILRVMDSTTAYPPVDFLVFNASIALCGRSFYTVLLYEVPTAGSLLADREAR